MILSLAEQRIELKNECEVSEEKEGWRNAANASYSSFFATDKHNALSPVAGSTELKFFKN